MLTVGPQCYVGKNKLERGISLYKSRHPDTEDIFSTTWLPFYLNPAAPKYGVDKRQYYQKKFGEQRTEMIFERLNAAGKDVGIVFKFGGKTGNTRDSHRLIQLGKTKSPHVQTRVVEELFKAYFENEQDITSHDVLREAGAKAGLGESEVREWLNSDKGGKEVDEEVMHAQMANISGVPNFTIQGKYEVGGAQDPAAFVQLFERLKAIEE
jgi:predicted DsbA family dithiol-disulfide isomerase